MSKRFEILECEEAKAAGIDTGSNEDRCYLVENMPNGAMREVGCDLGEPEDNMFRRDWRWVEPELNKLAEEAARLRQAIANLPDLENEEEECDTDDLLRGVMYARKALLSK